MYSTLIQLYYRYCNVRIDAVHYCDREVKLVNQRKASALHGRRGDVRDAAQERLQLFYRTVKDNDTLAASVESLKTPFMTREVCAPDLARAISVLPNLRYVDLPEDIFNETSTSAILRLELETRCPDLRWMKYAAGAEASFAALAQAKHWRNLEIVELHRPTVDASLICKVLSSLPNIKELVLSGVEGLDDSIFSPVLRPVPLPPVERLGLHDLPDITATGFVHYLSRPEVSGTITSITLSNTALPIHALNRILEPCVKLRNLHIVHMIDRPFPLGSVPPLISPSLKRLKYEINTRASHQRNGNPSFESYYLYLARSLLQGKLPSLTHLYALSTTLIAMLAPRSAIGIEQVPERSRASPENVIAQSLNVYTKSVSELEWNLTVINPPARGPQIESYETSTRPMSLHRPLPLSPQWREQGRESVSVGNGFGGFLTVPLQRSPVSPGQKSPRQDPDAWMG